MNTLKSAGTGQNILSEMAKIPVIIPGKLCERKGAGGKVNGWKLQRWRKGRNQTRYIPSELVERVREGTTGNERFMALAEEYAETKGQEALKSLAAPADSKKKPMRR